MQQWKNIELPIREVMPQVRSALAVHDSLILSAPPGAGKSTLLPLELMNESWLEGKKIILLEPRRLAARSIAYRMSELLGEEVGQTVGYRIRFEQKVSANTRIEILTEGILTRMLQSDNALEGVGMVIFDEFHERSLFADVALALCRESQQVLRPDLRLVIMSATLDMPQLTQWMNAPVVESPGRQYPVEIVHADGSDHTESPELAAQWVVTVSQRHEGDVLVFLPGEGEIRRCEALLKERLKGWAIHPLYGQLLQSRQTAAILPDRHGRRKVVLATSIAETSLTIQGVRIVVDTGWGRTAKFHPASGLTRLETVFVSLDRADQRAGRAGRTAPGVCYRLWNSAAHLRLLAHRNPEILEADLAGLVLDLAGWGLNQSDALNWLTPPPPGAVAQATDLLHRLDALEGGRITGYGKKMLQLPCHPRVAHMLIGAGELGHQALASDLAAILEERDPMPRETGADVSLRVEMLRRMRSQDRMGKGWDRIEKVAASYRNLLGAKPENSPVEPWDVGLLIAYAYPERIACARPGNNAPFQLSNGNMARMNVHDDLSHEPWLAVAHLDAREGMGRIFFAAPLNPSDLKPMVKQRSVVEWDLRKGGLVAQQEWRIGSILLQSKTLDKIDPELCTEAICSAVQRHATQLLSLSEEVVQWQNRILSLRVWNPQAGWPDVSTAKMLETVGDWLPPYLLRVTRNEDLQRLNLLEIWSHTLDYAMQTELDRLAPPKLQVPSGSWIRLSYSANGHQPVLAVRLQEVFGWADTPRINNQKTGVLMHLLSPGFKPVQVTSDLKSFWNNAYFEVKKELKSRYPKHVWPNDPWSEPAVRGARRKQ